MPQPYEDVHLGRGRMEVYQSLKGNTDFETEADYSRNDVNLTLMVAWWYHVSVT